ncbi:MAG: DPP IV N-terminal domain-containing protein [Weeksellaceae bacterium]
MKLFTFILVLFTLQSSMVSAQEKITIEDYNRAVGFMSDNYTNKTAFNLNIQPNWFSDNSGVSYVRHSPKEKRFFKISLPNLIKSDLFDHSKVSKLLSDLLGEDIQPNDLPITKIEFKNPNNFEITVADKVYGLNTTNYTLTNEIKEEKEEFSKESPNKKWTAFAKEYNLFIKSSGNNETKQLSEKGEKGYEYATYYAWDDIIEGENGNRPERFAIEWSPDSKWIYADIVDLRTAEKMYLLDFSIDSLYRPKLLSYYRGSPGDTTMVYVEPVFFNVESGKEIKTNLPRSTHINSTDVTWSKNSDLVFLESTSRGFQNKSIHTLDLKTEKLEQLYTESSKTNIDNFVYKLAEDSGLLFFLSEKSGWRQLYSLDLKTKKENALTNGSYYINSIERIDEKEKTIYFLASAKEKGRNPYYQNLYSISFQGKNLKLLTPEDRHHQISFSPDGKYFVDNFSTVNIPTITVLRKSSDGKILLELGRADVSQLKNWEAPEIFTATARDGKTLIYGALWKPTNFESSKKYPVIEMSYTGPHTQVFPKSFAQALSWQSYAELGFVVVVVDGLGSSGRSKKFHDYSYKNLGGGLEDHILAIQQLGQKYNWVDTSRVGIFGHSAGGYDAGRAVLAYPDFYKVAVASAADHDHRMEKAWWPEMYMGWPVDSAYHLQSNITNASNLKGKLLLVHGGIDENVNPSATFKLAEALINADKQFDMLILPSQRHGFKGNHLKYFTKVRWNYFVEHLRGVTPIWDFEWE